jgi:predicted DNA-binding ArsR family transcriptional regulator
VARYFLNKSQHAVAWLQHIGTLWAHIDQTRGPSTDREMTHILQPYELGLINAEVQSSEVLADVIYSLQQLSNTVDDVFTRIEKRLNDERNRVSYVNTRVNVCQQKVQLVKGSNRATTVFSTAKFPGPKDLHMYNSLFSQTKEVISAD